MKAAFRFDEDGYAVCTTCARVLDVDGNAEFLPCLHSRSSHREYSSSIGDEHSDLGFYTA